MKEIDEETYSKSDPTPLPTPRKRALTISLPISEEQVLWKRLTNIHSRQQTSSQSNSPLFSKLPVEARQLIYIEVFGGSSSAVVHIVQKHERLGHLRCKSSCSDKVFDEGAPIGESPCWAFGDEMETWLPSHENPRTDGGMVPILRSCRKIYCEAIDLLYEHTYFDFWGLNSFLDLSGTILLQQLNVIRKVNLTWYVRLRGDADMRKWECDCEGLARMQRLRILRIDIDTEIISYARARAVVEPLMRVKHVVDFVVRVGQYFGRQALAESTPLRFVFSDSESVFAMAIWSG